MRELADPKRPFGFEILCEEGGVKGAKLNRKGEMIQGNHSSYKIEAKDKLEMDEWIKCIRAAMMKDPVYELYRIRKDEAIHH